MLRRILAFALAAAAVIIVATLPGQGAVTASGPVLYGVTGEGGNQPETLFIIDHETAKTRLVTKLGNGGDGEEIAYNPDNGLLLHASGRGDDMVLEWVDPVTLAVTPLPHSGDDCDEVSGLTYAGNGAFIAGTIDYLLCSITADGVITELAPVGMADIATGLAWVNGHLWATEWGPNTDLQVLDPQTGEVTYIADLEVEAETFRLTALTGHPCTSELYAVMTVGPAEIRTPTSRHLVSINPPSGRVTIIGDLGQNFAGIAFAGGECEPKTARRPALEATSAPSNQVRPPATGSAGLRP